MKKAFWLTAFLAAPAVALAAEAPKTINQVFADFSLFTVALFVPVLVIVGFITLLSGVIKFIRAGDNEEMRESGRKVMIYGIVVLFVMVSFWGFVQLLSKSFLGADIQLNNYLPKPQTSW